MRHEGGSAACVELRSGGEVWSLGVGMTAKVADEVSLSSIVEHIPTSLVFKQEAVGEGEHDEGEPGDAGSGKTYCSSSWRSF